MAMFDASRLQSGKRQREVSQARDDLNTESSRGSPTCKRRHITENASASTSGYISNEGLFAVGTSTSSLYCLDYEPRGQPELPRHLDEENARQGYTSPIGMYNWSYNTSPYPLAESRHISSQITNDETVPLEDNPIDDLRIWEATFHSSLTSLNPSIPDSYAPIQNCQTWSEYNLWDNEEEFLALSHEQPDATLASTQLG
jgi:hypothetical protein